MQPRASSTQNVALILSIIALIIAFLSAFAVFLTWKGLQPSLTSAHSDYSSGSSQLTTGQYAKKYYSSYLAAFTDVAGASPATKKTCDALKATFISTMDTSYDSDGGGNIGLAVFDNPNDPLNVYPRLPLKCQATGAYRQNYLTDGERDPGYGDNYLVSTTLSVKVNADPEDMKDNRNVSLYSRYTGPGYVASNAKVPTCSIQNESRLTYLRVVHAQSDYLGYVMRYHRPDRPVPTTEGSRYAGVAQCSDGQLIVVDTVRHMPPMQLSIVSKS